MLCSLFLPIMLLVCCVWFMVLFYAPEETFTSQSFTLGVPSHWLMIALMLLPFVLYFWMFWSGNWRKPVLVGTLVYGICFFTMMLALELVEAYTPPEKRTIRLYGTEGTDVYCNGVHLGQLPLKIRVDELMAKVPEWTTPPEQRWYNDTDLEQRLVTYFPWDDFIKERYEASAELFGTSRDRNVGSTPKAIQARREVLSQHDAGCRYWWSYRFNDTQMAFYRNIRSYYQPFEKESHYYFGLGIMSAPFSPSVGFHAQLLVDVLPELTPEQKTDWDKHVLKHWSLLSGPLQDTLKGAATRHRRDKNETLVELYETALHSTARLHYGLSDPPTEEECRRLLVDWVKRAKNNFDEFGFRSSYDDNPGRPNVGTSVLIPAGINEMMRKPLTEQWGKNKYRLEHAWAPVAYFSGQNKSADYFADFVRWSATTGKARTALLENEAPGVVALFKTLLNRRALTDTFFQQIYLYANQISAYSQVNNSLIETDLRDYIVKALSDPKHDGSSRPPLERAVRNAIFQRIDWKDIDKDEFSAWISLLPIPVATKTLVQQLLRLRSDEPLTFADQLQQNAGRLVLIETELTLDDVVQWFADNPEGSLLLFLKEQEENISVNDMSKQDRYREVYYPGLVGGAIGRTENEFYVQWEGLPHLFALTLLRMDTPEGEPQIRELLRRMLTNMQTSYFVEQAIKTEYGTFDLRLNRRSDFAVNVGSIHLPDYILDLLLSSEVTQAAETPGGQVTTDRTALASTLALCESPKAEEILEKWLAEVQALVKPQVERCLEIWRTRNALRQTKMAVFQDLVAGRIVPDDLLLPQPAWVWKDGEYVQAE